MIINDVNSLMRWKTSPLPAGYTLLNWIGATGTQYIDLNLSVVSNYEIVGNLLITDTYNSSDTTTRTIVGCDSLGLDYKRNSRLPYGSSYFEPYNTDIYDGLYHDWRCSVGTKSETTYPKQADYDTYSRDYTSSWVAASPIWWVFRHTVSNGFAKANVKYLKIYVANNLVRDLYPAMRDLDSVIGMYDTANNVFYTNAGTGSFTYG